MAPLTTYGYDGLSRLVIRTDADPDQGGPQAARVTHWTFDAAGQLTQFQDPLNRNTYYTRDNMGRVTLVTDQMGRTQGIAYDMASTVTTVTDGQRFITNYTLDALDRVTKVRDPRNWTGRQVRAAGSGSSQRSVTQRLATDPRPAEDRWRLKARQRAAFRSLVPSRPWAARRTFNPPPLAPGSVDSPASAPAVRRISDSSRVPSAKVSALLLSRRA